jgi:hypothetical protein
VIRLLAAAVLSGLAFGAGSAEAAVVDCHVWAKYPNTMISSARNMTCRAAANDMRSYRGQIYRRFKTPAGFVCQRVSGGQFGGQWRCVRGNRAYRFEFGD